MGNVLFLQDTPLVDFAAGQRHYATRKGCVQAQRSPFGWRCAVAKVCGFCNAGHFVNVFRQAVGMTPGRWREAQQGK